MKTREELRQDGVEMRDKLGFPAANAASELAPGLDNLATDLVFGSIWARSGLALEDRMLASLSALTSRQDMPQLRHYIGAALHIGLTPRAVQEVFIMCGGLYSGFSTILNSLALAKEVFEERGIAMPDTEIAELDAESLMERGLDTMQKLHGGRRQTGYSSPDNTASALYSLAIEYGYGEIWVRPDLDLRQRMICAVASFTAIEQLAQLKKFVPSALNIGLSREQVIEIIIQTVPYSGFTRALNALSVLGESI